MNVHSVIVLCAGSIAFCVGVYHFMYHARLHSRAVDLAFAATCFMAALYDIVSALLYSVDSVSCGVVWQRWQFVLLCGLGASFVWFVSEFIERKSRRVDYVLMAYWAIQAVVLATDRTSLTLTNSASVKTFSFLGTFPITYYEVMPGISTIIQGIVGFLSCLYILHGLWKYNKFDSTKLSTPIVVGLSVFVISIVSDTMVGWGVYNFIYLMEVAFLAMLVCMGYSLNEMHLNTQDELQRTSEGLLKLEAAVKAAAESIVVTDINGSIQYVNPAFEEMTGYSKAEVIGQNSGVVKSGKHAEGMYSDLWSTISDGKVWRGHFTNRKKDGSLFQEDAVISPIRSEKGDIVSFVAVKRDITQELRLENQLRHSQKMEALGRLASGVAHDFTNMLAIIMGHSQLLQTKVGTDVECAEHLLAVNEATSRLSSLTGDLLAFAHQKPLALKMMNLNRVLQGMIELLDRSMDHDIELSLNISEKKFMVELDPNHIEQALMYLVVNAVDAMSDGGKLSIETSEISFSDKEVIQCHEGMRECSVEGGNFAVITVTDTGCGMSEDVRSRVFEPFFTTKGRARTTGLGLSTAYGIVSQHNGNVTVYSTPGNGTTFRIYLPLADQCKTIEKNREVTGEGKPKTILAAEDDYIVRNILVHILQNLGFSVLEAEDSVQAQDLFDQHKDKIDLLITDVMMPENGGVQLAEDLRAISPDLPVIFASGYPESHLRQTGIITNGDMIMNKPLTRAAVARAIEETMKK